MPVEESFSGLFWREIFGRLKHCRPVISTDERTFNLIVKSWSKCCTKPGHLFPNATAQRPAASTNSNESNRIENLIVLFTLRSATRFRRNVWILFGVFHSCWSIVILDAVPGENQIVLSFWHSVCLLLGLEKVQHAAVTMIFASNMPHSMSCHFWSVSCATEHCLRCSLSPSQKIKANATGILVVKKQNAEQCGKPKCHQLSLSQLHGVCRKR